MAFNVLINCWGEIASDFKDYLFSFLESNGYVPYYDEKHYSETDVNQRYSIIEECSDIILLMSGCALIQPKIKESVRMEIKYALNKNKNISPSDIRKQARTQ